MLATPIFRLAVSQMSFDGVVTRAVVHELQDLIGGRTAKIYQPQPTELVFHIRKQRETKRLLLSAHSQFARLQLTNESFDNPKNPPMFCMLLRKHLDGGIIDSIEQYGMERMVTIRFKTTNELGDPAYKQLVIELMGRHSNIVLLDNEKNIILDSIKHIPPSINRYRTVLP
ncbi:MAG TPA: NFACT family protein, partial [Bacillales bacterium]|nr:NFACT family protein [Bacillales bacterium]